MYIRIVAALAVLTACNRLDGTSDGNIDALPQLAVEEQLLTPCGLHYCDTP